MTPAITFLGGVRYGAPEGALSAPITFDTTLLLVGLAATALACSVALELGARAAAREKGGLAWRIGAGLMLGLGVWTAPFMGVLAYHNPWVRSVAWQEAGIAAAVAAALGATALIVAGPRPGLPRAVLIGAAAAVGAGLLHAWSMLGLQLDAEVSVRPEGVAGEAAVASVIGAGTIMALYNLRAWFARVAAAAVLATGLMGLHALDVAATVLLPQPSFTPPPPLGAWTQISFAVLAAWAVLWLAAQMIAAHDRRRLDLQDQERHDREEPVQIRPPEGQGRPQPNPVVTDEETIVVIPMPRAQRPPTPPPATETPPPPPPTGPLRAGPAPPKRP